MTARRDPTRRSAPGRSPADRTPVASHPGDAVARFLASPAASILPAVVRADLERAIRRRAHQRALMRRRRLPS